jgi:copper chaperone CopZ
VRSQEIVVEIAGMKAADCEPLVAAALMAVPGVHAVRVERDQGRAVVTGDPSVAVPELLRAAVAGAHFEPGDVWLPE